jgi:HEAT repeat protein
MIDANQRNLSRGRHMKSLIAGACPLALILALGTVPLPAQTPWQQAWGILEAGAREKSTEKRTQAVRVLGLLPGDPKALAIAEKALEDEKPEVKVAAAEALGQMGSPASIPKLKKTLGDKEARVVLAAAHALRALNDPTAYEVYYEVLTGERKSGEGLIAEGRDRKSVV